MASSQSYYDMNTKTSPAGLSVVCLYLMTFQGVTAYVELVCVLLYAQVYVFFFVLISDVLRMMCGTGPGPMTIHRKTIITSHFMEPKACICPSMKASMQPHGPMIMSDPQIMLIIMLS